LLPGDMRAAEKALATALPEMVKLPLLLLAPAPEIFPLLSSVRFSVMIAVLSLALAPE
jgi:hypothetical protein